MQSPVLLRKEPQRRVFSLEEARRTLPLVRRIAKDIVETFERLSDLEDRRAKLSRSGEAVEARSVQVEAASLVEQLKGLIRELEPIGCQLKDPRVGLIDFPAMHQEREVLLCWKHGEQTIDHWHETDAGFAGRRPVSELEP